MVVKSASAKKRAEQKEIGQEEEAKSNADLKAQEKAEKDRIAADEKVIADAEKAEEEAEKKAEKQHSLIVVDVGKYIGQVSAREVEGSDRRLAGIRLMFEELGVEKYVEKVTYKGTEAFVFKK